MLKKKDLRRSGGKAPLDKRLSYPRVLSKRDKERQFEPLSKRRWVEKGQGLNPNLGGEIYMLTSIINLNEL